MTCKFCGKAIEGATARTMILVTVHTPTQDRQDCNSIDAIICSFRCLTEWAEQQENTPADEDAGTDSYVPYSIDAYRRER